LAGEGEGEGEGEEDSISGTPVARTGSRKSRRSLQDRAQAREDGML